MRAKDNLRYEVLTTHAKGDCTISMPVSPRARKLHPHLPTHWQARLIEVELDGRTRRFITSLTDAKRYPRRELAQLYAKRWEIKLGFREIKNSLQAAAFVLRFAPLESAATLPRRLALLFEQAHLFVIPERRTARSYPKVVKRRPVKYPIKMPVSV